MDTFENENIEQEELHTEPAPQEPVQPEPQPEQSFYYGAGARQKESPFVNSPYVTYRPYQSQPTYQQTYRQPWQQPAQPVQTPPAPKQEKKKHKKLKRWIAAVLVLACVISGCGLTALLVNNYWRQQNDTLRLYFNEKIDILQQQISANKDKLEQNGGDLVTPGENMTASEIYSQNLESVVAITCRSLRDNYGQMVEGVSSGSGFILTEDGYVVTNHHVIEGATKITVTMADGRELDAKLIGSDDTNDVALIKMEATGLRPVTVGSSSAMDVGDQVVAIGNALGEFSFSLTVGYISGIDRDVNTDGSIINMIQTDVAINSGNSGGPLFNARGEVIGITTAKYSGTTSSGASIEGISFAIPMDDVIGMLEDLRDLGYIRSPYLGVSVRDVDAMVSQMYGLPTGAYVVEAVPGNCAANAGIQAKDIIVEVGGYEVKNVNDLGRALRHFEAGDTITVTVWRAGQEMVLTVTLDENPNH